MPYEIGQIIEVPAGAFAGMQARVTAVDGDSVSLAVSMFGKEVPTVLRDPSSSVRRAKARGPRRPTPEEEREARAAWRRERLHTEPPRGWREPFEATVQPDPKGDWQAEVRRAAEQKWEAMDRYGLAGLRAVWASEGRDGTLIPLSELSQEHAWRSLASRPPEDAISELFGPLGGLEHPVAATLAARVRLLLANRLPDGPPALVYAVDRLEQVWDGERYVPTDVPGFIVGQPPRVGESLSPYATERGWTVPGPLAALYTVHNGVGLDPYGWNAVRSLQALEVVGEMMIPIVTEQDDLPDDYDYDDLLGFYHDGTGNLQCVHRALGLEVTRDWDHETRKLGTPQSFEAFWRERLPRVWLGLER